MHFCDLLYCNSNILCSEVFLHPLPTNYPWISWTKHRICLGRAIELSVIMAIKLYWHDATQTTDRVWLNSLYLQLRIFKTPLFKFLPWRSRWVFDDTEVAFDQAVSPKEFRMLQKEPPKCISFSGNYKRKLKVLMNWCLDLTNPLMEQNRATVFCELQDTKESN